MSFDIYNQATWDPNYMVASGQEVLKNKAMGAIGNMIGDIKELKVRLESQVQETKEYNIAQQLMKNNFELYFMMNISYEYPNEKFAETLGAVNAILEMWKNVQNRHASWREIAAKINELKEFMPDKKRGGYFYTSNEHIKNAERLNTIKVCGNVVWTNYLRQEERVTFWRDKAEEYRKQYDGCSCDCCDDDCENDSEDDCDCSDDSVNE